MRIFGWVLGVLVVVTGLGVWTAPPAAACSCAALSDAERLAESRAVFVGEVTEVGFPVPGELGGSAPVTFAVDGVIKGDVAAEQQVTLGGFGTSCETGITVGQYLLVFAYVGDAPSELDMAFCGGSRVVSPGVQPEGLPAVVPIGEQDGDAAPTTVSASAPSQVPGTGALATGEDGAPGGGGPDPWVAGAAVVAVAAVVGSSVALRRNRRNRRSRRNSWG